ncbi:ABC transporter substrate-binding protein [Frankia nepalensis]|uniref:ABC transporter substrate-binding protein n=1 Tax=Frankia nepalensis TaxID=1836974 RepID=A0A937USH8_9ACTN|nr:ABC transporter substrate-binding protein [Frankia nepalensis]MBL7499948.1 ABC transporter substrate-binding protein [Frankia nepalensis]MBL7515066.1 ABC transporter substrate-binding protein [Frankia nepalensis]MBL7632128.1 ABC transporter substrate-binding protein [Frankia nepalensis]
MAATLAATVVLAGCGGSPARGPGPASVSPSTVKALPTDKPGGSLRLTTAFLPSGDPGWAVTTADRVLARLVSRSLYAYPADQDVGNATIPRPDLASGAPVRSENDLVVTVRLRSNVSWDLSTPRRIIASDVARGLKRLCLPPEPSPLRGYLAATIEGYNDFCTALATKPVDQARDFLESTSVPGIQVASNFEISFHLIKPTNDFVDILALPAAAPVPFEALSYPPNSPEYLAHLVSSGPYRVSAVSGGTYELKRNGQWSKNLDSIRRALPDRIVITTGVDAAAAQAQIEAGEADMTLDAAVPLDRAAALLAAGDERLSVPTTGSTLLLAVARNGPAAAALSEGTVRAALATCVDRIAVVTALGGPPFATATTQLLQGTMTGYSPLDPFPTPNGAGDATKCAEGLASAPGGPVSQLTLLTTDSARDGAVAGALVDTFAKVGVRLDVQARSAADFATAAVSPLGQSWDLALTSITPRWYGDAGRTVFQPLLDPFWVGQRPVDGGYDSADVLAAMGVALRADSEPAKAVAWADVEKTVLRDVAVIPLAVVAEPRFHGDAVLSFTQIPSLGTGDPASLAVGPA